MEKYTFKFQKTSRIIAIILLCVTVLSSTCITAFAEENNAINKPETNIATVLTTVGKVIDGGQVIIDVTAKKIIYIVNLQIKMKQLQI